MFAGIGGLELGLERAGMSVRWQVEIDDYATRVLEKHWPRVRRWRDIKTFPPNTNSNELWNEPGGRCGESGADPTKPSGDGEDWRVDLICGGFPCQDISKAGAGRGIEGARSGLFFEAVRVVAILKPRYVLLENVSALLARGLDRVLGELASVGYDAEWHCLQAADVGAPHLRDRVFIIGTKTRDIPDADSRRLKGGGEPKETLLPESHRRSLSGPQEVAHARGERQQAERQPREPVCSTENTSGKASGSLADSFWDAEPGVRGVAYGIPKRVDRLRCLGNAVVPQVAELIGREIVKHASKEELCRG